VIFFLAEAYKMTNEIKELLKLFFPWEEIHYIENMGEYRNNGYLLHSILLDNEGGLYAQALLYEDGHRVNESKENILNLNTYRYSIEKDIKIAIKKSIFNCLIETSGQKLPWGILTGIRPLKIIHELMDKNIENEEIIHILTGEYRLDMEKAKLALDISQRQRKYIYPLDKDRYSLYISIPFCPTRCFYCSFPALPLKGHQTYIGSYIDRLIFEIRSISGMMKGKKINTVYIGGGTPTAIPVRDLERVIKEVYESFGKDSIREFTVEAGRPDTITEEYLKMLDDNEIRRISINPQTMKDNTLKTIGRNHKAEDIIRVYWQARGYGFKVINMDLIVGLPGEGIDDLRHSLKELRKLDPENITIHTLSIKRGSKFFNSIDRQSIENQKLVEDMLKESSRYAEEMKLKPYYLYRQKQILGNFENIGYAKASSECIYNIVMMEEKETILGAGMGAVSKVFYPGENRLERIPNFKDLREYLGRVEELVAKKEELLKD